MSKPQLVSANLPTLPTAQLLARLSAEPGRAEMTVDTASPWVAGVIVRTPRFLLALHAVSESEAQIIASPRVPGLEGSGDAQLQALLANAAPTREELYRTVPPPDVTEAGPPPLPVSVEAQVNRPANDLPLGVMWIVLAVLFMGVPSYWVMSLTAMLMFGAAAFAFVPLPRQNSVSSPLRTVSLVLGVVALLLAILASFNYIPVMAVALALASAVTGTLARLQGRVTAQTPSAPASAEPAAPRTQALPAPQVQLIETTRAQLLEHLEVAERSGSARDVFEAKQALEVHLPEVVSRWEALPSWRRRDDAPLRRTLERLGTASVPDTTTSELEWDATERFIEQKARQKDDSAGELSVREPLTPPSRIQDKAK